VETIAVYWEAKPKTYGFTEVTDLSLLNIEVAPDKLAHWGLWLLELADIRVDFHLVLAKYSTQQKLRLYILLEKPWVDRVLLQVGKGIDPDSKDNLHLTSPVELITFQGPHFGDRYGIAHSALKALDDQGMPILVAACSGAAVYLVLPERMLEKARLSLAEVFEVP
jgi:aspartokinase